MKTTIDKTLNTDKVTPEIIDYIVTKIVREIQPEKIILFGSYARGDFDPDSDLDLFIIKDGKESSRTMSQKVHSLLWDWKFPMDILVRKPKEVEWNFKAKNPFYLYHIFKDGKVLYERKTSKTHNYFLKSSILRNSNKTNMKKNKEEKELVSDWLRLAKENLTITGLSIKEESPPSHTICYLCQGSAEKYIKAFLIWKGWELVKTHNMEELLSFSIEYDPEFEKLRAECKILNKYITEGRYPGDLPFEHIDKDDAVEAIEAAKKIEKLVLNKVEIELGN